MANFSDDTIQKVWEKGTVVPNYDPAVWRKDHCGAWINRNQYGNRKSDWGWEIDHITLESNGGSDNLSNLRPLQWENNASRQEKYWSCKITSPGTKNVAKR